MMTSSKSHDLPLPAGVTENQVDCTSTCGLSFHILEAGRSPGRETPLILLLHGFPELGFSWRKIMPALAAAGFYVIAPDQRGYGRTTGWDNSKFEETDLGQYTMTKLVSDMVVLVHAIGYSSVRCVVGHDFGAVSSAMCALMRPDFFQSCVTMSHPFKGSPSLPMNILHASPQRQASREAQSDVHDDLANLPVPRKHYKWYNSTAYAASDWINPPQGLHTFLRGYVHLKSADWAENKPFPLKSWTADELAKMPHYYILPLNSTMPEAVAGAMDGEDANLTTRWLSDEDIAVYVQEWTRTGFQGGLNWYRSTTDPANMKDMLLFAGKKIEVPFVYISGESDWGNYQEPGVLENLSRHCSQFKGVKWVKGAGHWPQQEQPVQVSVEILAFLKEI